MPDGTTEWTGATVVIDFDRAVAMADEVEVLVERLGAPEWCELHGDGDSWSSVLDAWASIAADEATLRTAAAEIPFDPDFAPLVADLRAVGADVVVVSTGFGLAVESACVGLDVEVLSNRIDFATGRLEMCDDDPASCRTADRVVRFDTLVDIRAALSEVAV
jgi:2-hydroxy-3-keto-5-methylthiopentenyl-1-phosphate phosphatase